MKGQLDIKGFCHVPVIQFRDYMLAFKISTSISPLARNNTPNTTSGIFGVAVASWN